MASGPTKNDHPCLTFHLCRKNTTGPCHIVLDIVLHACDLSSTPPTNILSISCTELYIICMYVFVCLLVQIVGGDPDYCDWLPPDCKLTNSYIYRTLHTIKKNMTLRGEGVRDVLA